IEEVLDRLLSKVVVDPKDGLLREVRMKRAVERLRGCQITPEGFSITTREPCEQPAFRQPFNHDREHARRNGQVVQRVLGIAELFAQSRERRRLAIIAADIAKPPRHLGEGLIIQSAMLRQTIAWRAGNIFLYARSPLAPKKTIASDV